MATNAEPVTSKALRRIRRLESSPGRRLAIGVLLGLIALVSVTIWRMGSLDGLPDVGDPFDVAEARKPIEIPDADNAFVAYAKAHPLLDPSNSADKGARDLLLEPIWDDKLKPPSWASAPPRLREYVEAKRAALEIWRDGSRRRDAVYYQPDRLSIDSGLYLLESATVAAGLAALEGSRVEESGARMEAWDWYLAMLRCSRLIGRHGVLIQRMRGARIHSLASRCILRWVSDRRLSAGDLRLALNETLEADALTPPVSEAIKLGHLAALKSLEDMSCFERMMRSFGQTLPLFGGRQPSVLDRVLPPFAKLPVQRIRLSASNELERTRRTFRLFDANWLAQVDRPPGQRAPLAIRKPVWIYANDPSAPASARAVSPEFLLSALERMEISGLVFGPDRDPSDPPWEGNGELARERRCRSVLIVRLAAELYRREHGVAPATAGALLATVLKELPEGIAAADPIPAGLE